MEPTVVDDSVVSELRELVELAPLQMQPALDAIARHGARSRTLPHVAVFDTEFHATLPERASTYALPDGGAHWAFGASASTACRSPGRQSRFRCRASSSATSAAAALSRAVLDGRSVDTTMGFTPLDGVPMATRPGQR